MPARKKSVTQAQGKTLEAQLWDAADKMRGAVPPTDYQHVCLGLVFLRYLSAAFARKHAELLETPHADAEDPEELSGARQTAAGSPMGERGGANQFYTPCCVVRCLDEVLAPYNALRCSALLQSEASPQVVSAAKDNMAGVDFVCLSCASAVLANGSVSSNQSGDCPARSATNTPRSKPQSLPRQRDIRRALIEADLVDTALRDSAFLQSEASPQVLSKAKNNMVALPGQLFYSTQIPVCLWFIARDKSGGQPSPRPSPTGRGRSAAEGEGRLRDRRRQTLFIDARKLGTLIDRVHRELTDADLEKITSTYHAWRQAVPAPKSPAANYEDVPGFCKSATSQEIAAHGHVLTPGRYVGAEEVEDDGDPFEEKMPRLVAELHAQFAESAKLEQAIKANLRGLGYGG
jgi:hypothetical protein